MLNSPKENNAMIVMIRLMTEVIYFLDPQENPIEDAKKMLPNTIKV